MHDHSSISLHLSRNGRLISLATLYPLNTRSSHSQATQREARIRAARPTNAERENVERKPEDSANGIPILRETDPRESLCELQDE